MPSFVGEFEGLEILLHPCNFVLVGFILLRSEDLRHLLAGVCHRRLRVNRVELPQNYAAKAPKQIEEPEREGERD